MTIIVYTTGSGAELIPKLMINGGKQIVYALPIADLEEGDILDVTCEAQVTNNNSKEAMLSAQLWLSPSATMTVDPKTNDPEGCVPLNHGNCTNVTPTQHHFTLSKNAIAAVKAPMAMAYVLLVVNSAWSYAPNSGAFLLVDNGNGSLQVKKTRQ